MSGLPVEYLPAHELLRRFRSGALSPVEVLHAQIARVEAVNHIVNAITFEHFESALVAAKAAEGRYRSGTALPLDGITVGVKDGHGLAGWAITRGSLLDGDATLTKTDPVAAALVGAGAVMPFQTTVPELSLSPLTWSERLGVTRSPWNPRYTAGGSSGGSGAALAAGMCTLATGSDIGGSIRIPSALNGLYGIKPSTRPVDHLEAASGAMARTPDDVVLMQAALSRRLPATSAGVDLESVRLAVSVDQGWATVDRETTANLRAACEDLRRLGVKVDEIELDLGVGVAEFGAIFDEAFLATPFGSSLADIPAGAPVTAYARDLADRAARSPGQSAIRRLDDLARQIGDRLEQQVFGAGYDVLVTATLTTSHVEAGLDHIHDTIEVDGQPLETFYAWILTPLFNMLSAHPVVSVPTGLTGEGMPTGMQIVAGPAEDETALALAAGFAAISPALFQDGRFPPFPESQMPS